MHRVTLFSVLGAIIAAFLPHYGIVDQGRRFVNPLARPLLAEVLLPCKPQTPNWENCK
jgi:hypothetical protein